jgi:SOS-response transcriptional repressor LexA
MIEAGIFYGDLALIQPQPSAENGQIVVALIDVKLP